MPATPTSSRSTTAKVCPRARCRTRITPVEYPVLTGAFMGLIGLPVHAYTKSRPEREPVHVFYNINALVLCALAVADGW